MGCSHLLESLERQQFSLLLTLAWRVQWNTSTGYGRDWPEDIINFQIQQIKCPGPSSAISRNHGLECTETPVSTSALLSEVSWGWFG